MKFYDETKPLHIERDASGVGLGAGQLQIRSGTSHARDETPDNSILRPIIFVSKSLSSAEKRYSKIERQTLGILYGLKKFHQYMLCKRGEYNHRSQTSGNNIKKRCSNIISETTMNSTQNTPIKSQDHIQAFTRSIHSRLEFQAKPQGKKRCRNTWDAVKY